MPQDRMSMNNLLKMNRNSTLNSLQDASNQNIDRAMQMFSNLNPTEIAMNNIARRNDTRNNTVINPPFPNKSNSQLLDTNQLMLGVALGALGTVLGGLILDWIRKK